MLHKYKEKFSTIPLCGYTFERAPYSMRVPGKVELHCLPAVDDIIYKGIAPLYLKQMKTQESLK